MRQHDCEELLSIREAAKKVGLDKSTLARQVNAGLIRSHGGKVRVSEVLADRAANIDLTRSRRGKKTNKQGGASGVSDAPVDAPIASDRNEDEPEIVLVDGKALPFPVAKALKETYLARLRQLEFELKRGQLIELAAAKDVFFDCARETVMPGSAGRRASERSRRPNWASSPSGSQPSSAALWPST